MVVSGREITNHPPAAATAGFCRDGEFGAADKSPGVLVVALPQQAIGRPEVPSSMEDRQSLQPMPPVSVPRHDVPIGTNSSPPEDARRRSPGVLLFSDVCLDTTRLCATACTQAVGIARATALLEYKQWHTWKTSK
jgi:hypothetical protein